MSESKTNQWEFALRHTLCVFYILFFVIGSESSSVLTDIKNQNKDQNSMTSALHDVNMNLMRQLINQETLIRASMTKTITDMTKDFAIMKKTLVEAQMELMAIKDENKRLRKKVSKNELRIANYNATLEQSLTQQDTLMRKVNGHAVKLEAVSSENMALKERISENGKALAEMNFTISDTPSTMVAFTVKLSGSYSKSGSNIISNKILTNIGGGYNGTNGVFTCPVKGLYSFHVHLISNSRHKGVWIYKNNKKMTIAYSARAALDGGSASLVTYLYTGNTITVKTQYGGFSLDAETNFSGMKIQ